MKLPASTSIHHVHLRVADLAAGRKFYEKLGFRVVNSGDDFVWLSPTGEEPVLLILSSPPGTRPRQPFAPGLFHVAYLVPSRRELARTLKHLGESGIRASGFADHLVSEAVYLSDPEGNGIEIYCDRPRAEWPVRGDSVQMATLGLDIQGLLNEADDAAPWAGFHPETRIGHIHLQVSSLSNAEQFYHRLLGFDVTQRSYPGALFLSAGGYHHHIGLNIWNSEGVERAPDGSVGLASFGIALPDTESASSVLRRLEKSGRDIEPTGSSYFVRDDDGILIELLDQSQQQSSI